MKILWLSHFIPYPPKGGVLQRGYHLLRQTCKYHDVHLLAFNQKDLIAPLFSNLEDGINEARQHLNEFCESVEFEPLPLDQSPFKKKWVALASLVRTTPYTMNWLESEQYTQRLKSLLERHQFDLIHFDTISLAPLKTYCGKLPTSLDHHNIESHMLLRRASKESSWLKRLYFQQEGIRLEKYEKKYCPKFSFNFTCSEMDSQRLTKISPKSKVHSIANGVDTDFFSPSPEMTKSPKLLFIGTLSWYPNIEAVQFIAEQLWPVLKRTFPDVNIDIIGANPPESILQLAEKDPSFRVHGFVDDIRPFFKQAQCYVCPIKDGGGTKLKIVDALSMGIAIVADEIACEGIGVSNFENVIFASTPQEYCDAISTVFADKAQRQKMERKGRELAIRDYSYDMIGQQLAELFTRYELSSCQGEPNECAE